MRPVDEKSSRFCDEGNMTPSAPEQMDVTVANTRAIVFL